MTTIEKENSYLEIALPEYSYVGRVEKHFHEIYDSNSYSRTLVISFEDVSYIQLTTLVFLAQLIYKREKTNLRTRIKRPLENDVRIFLFTWRFYEIIEELTGKSIHQFFVNQSIETSKPTFLIDGVTYFVDLSKDFFSKYYKEEQLKSLVKKGFFSLICEPFKEEKQKLLALKKQRRKWTTEKLITDVLQKNLIEKQPIGNLLANTIIFECLTNAANHPSSNNLVIGSFYDYTKNSRSKTGKRYYTVVLWDNGDSIIKTLTDSILDLKNIRAEESFKVAKKANLKSWFRIVRKNYNNEVENEDLFFNYLPNKNSSPDEILLSSFFPGISRMPNNDLSENTVTHSDFDTTSGSGLGLSLLLKAVIKDLQGSIHLRTDDYLLEITPARKGGAIEHNDLLFFKRKYENGAEDVDFKCKCSLRKYETNELKFMGNMITVKLPLEES
ncbi:hypothetical protein [Maribacter sp. 2308TA10-17]|uniref:hypothetical protein n=1 Tax=Maribacter sp. 2308TA10-17 TaxID=3386276 RepID=UPI0039BC72E9